MKTSRIAALLICLFPACALAEPMPKQCELAGYFHYTRMIELFMSEHICKTLFPSTSQQFTLVLSKYEHDDPQCYSVTRAQPELSKFLASTELAGYIKAHRDKTIAPAESRRTRQVCENVVADERAYRKRRDEMYKLFQWKKADP